MQGFEAPFNRGTFRPISSRVSPLNKEAIPLGAIGRGIKALFQFGKGLVDNLAAKIGKGAFKAATSGGEEAVDLARKAYPSIFDEAVDARRLSLFPEDEIAEETTEAVAKQVDTIMDDLTQVRSVASQTGAKISQDLAKANKGLSNSISKLNTEAVAIKQERDRMLRKLRTWEALESDKRVKSVGEHLAARVRQLDGEFAVKSGQLKELSDIHRVATTPGKEAMAMQQLVNSTEEGVRNVPGITQWYSEMQSLFHTNKQVLGMTSRNLGNDTKFLQEYLALKRNPSAAGKLELWVSNPSNFRKLEELHQSDRIFDIINAGKLSRRQKLLGITPRDMAKRLGLGTAAAGTGVIGLYSWFSGSNNPAVVGHQAAQMGGSVQTLQSRGDGGKILNDVKRSLGNIEKLVADVNPKLSTPEAPAATELYINEMSKELMVLIGAIRKWPTVVQNSNNPKLAQAQGQDLYRFVDTQIKGLKSLAEQLGISIQMPGTAPGIAGLTTQRSPDSDNLTKIQGFLRLNQTGRLDGATIQALRNLEYRFNKRARTSEFTGTFVVPEAGHVVSYDDLIKAYKIIQKYDESELGQ